MPIDLSPLLGLRLRTPRLELRLPSLEKVGELAALAALGVHPPEQMPFAVAWTDGIGSPSFGDDVRAYHLGIRDGWSPDDWVLECGVWVDGQLIGVQALRATDFARHREVDSGSWLGQAFQGRGYGTEMRAAILHLAFAGLGAEAAESGALAGNTASERVSEKLGYRRAGERTAAPRGTPVREQLFRLDRASWEASDRTPVTVFGLTPCRPLFGATA